MMISKTEKTIDSMRNIIEWISNFIFPMTLKRLELLSRFL